MEFIIYILIGLAVGSLIGFLSYKWMQTAIIRRAQNDAQELISEAKEEVELRLLDEKEKTQEIETEMWAKHEPEMLKSEEKIENLQELVDEKKKKRDQEINDLRSRTQKRENEIKVQEKAVADKDQKFSEVKSKFKEMNERYVQVLASKLNISSLDAKKEIQSQLLREAQVSAKTHADLYEEDIKIHVEQKAKRLLDIALDRFVRPYCPERGISSVNFPDEHTKKTFSDPKNIQAVQEATGCDIIVENEMDYIGVSGYDPVRRELTRRVLERLMREKKNLNPDGIKRVAEQTKKELMKQITQDGDQIAKELKLEHLHPEIRQMMGSLRYRYSFTQNQYFHCAEVGWLCGLLSAELGLKISEGRRAGMLHDLGKSMDHTLDGGHAMIGADFIEKRGERAEIVHAVRSHHFDEQPSSDLAFLVIGADAVSGARPGARRSTIESYAQKLNELDSIARSFEGVTDAFILNGGRECRVVVNGKTIDDAKAIKIGQSITKRIEEECNYPGQIRVVVVRETVVVEHTRGY